MRFTGEVEVLKPLAVLDFTTKRDAVADNSVPLGLSWFHRSLVAGGAFALFAVVLSSAIFIAMYDGNESTEVSEAAGVPEAIVTSDVLDNATDPSTADISFSSEPSDADATTSFEIGDRQPAIRARKISRFKPRLQPLRSQYTASDFTPTTLVIYIEKGQIKTRIEPQLTTDKKTLTFSN